VVAERVERMTSLVEELTAQRAVERVGEHVVVLVEEHDDEDPKVAVGRAEHQGPDVDGVCLVRAGGDGVVPVVGSFVEAVVVDAVGVDLVVETR
jgi:tRNA A37 methylthiotransferase MiaB